MMMETMMEMVWIFSTAVLLGATVHAAPSGTMRQEYPETTQILDHAAKGTDTWDRLAEMCDTFGPRMTGSDGLEAALDWISDTATKDGMKVLREPVDVPNWKRNGESLKLLVEGFNFEREIPMIGLGLSVGTGGRAVSGDLVVVKSWDELSLADVSGRIVLMNVPWDGYNSQYRRDIGARAAERGAIAALVRSVTPFSLGTLHTGSSTTATIPSAAITTEDADMLERMQARGQRMRLSLTMGATGCSVTAGCETFTSSNVVVEIVGSELPNEIVGIGGHIDSWDVGQGAIDDGGGAFAAWGAVKLLHELGIKPKRTIRAIFWNAEENSGAGADAYFKAHNSKKHIAVLESDGGVWDPYGYTVSESSIDAASFAAMQKIGSTQLARIGAGNVSYGGAGADTQVWCSTTPCGSQVVVDPNTGVPPVAGGSYFDFHHTNADFVSKFTPEELDRNVASFAVMAWALAEYGFNPPVDNTKYSQA